MSEAKIAEKQSDTSSKNLFRKGEARTKEAGRKGGIASGKARRERKSMEEDLKVLLNLSLDRGKITDIDSAGSYQDLLGANITVQQSILLKIIQAALVGDVRAAQYLRDTAGEMPVRKVDVDATVDTSVLDDINRQLEE